VTDEADMIMDGDWAELISLVSANPPRPASECGSFECEPDWSWRRRFSDFDAWLVVHGSGHGSINDERADVQPGSLLVLRPGDEVTMDQDPRDRLSVLAVHFAFRDARTGEAVEPEPRWLPDRNTLLPQLAPVVDLMRRLVRLSRDPHPLRRLEADGAMLALLAEIYRQQATAVGQRIPMIDSRLQDVIEAVAANPARRFGLAEAAGIADLPAVRFSRLFKRLVGVTFRQFVVQVRLERAKTLLEETTMSVSQIARALGYPDAFTFSRQFRDHYGQPPSALRL